MNTTLFFAAFMGLGGPEMAVIFILLLLLFGAKKLPELARGMGKSLGEFKKARQEFEEEIQKGGDEISKGRDEAKRELTEAAGKQQYPG